jgi:predicted kinase
MLIIFGGLPGTGKSTIARLLAKRLKATYLRIDTIEQTLRACSTPQAAVTSEGYLVAYHVAGDNLRTGGTVIADSVNPVAETRAAWRAVAAAVEIETICSDPHEHRRWVETRVTDVPGLVIPARDSVLRREYQPWTRPHLVLDTASRTEAACLDELLEQYQPDSNSEANSG